jgi:hypothetical protein
MQPIGYALVDIGGEVSRQSVDETQPLYSRLVTRD